MGRIEVDIALESWVCGFRPCSIQRQLTLGRVNCRTKLMGWSNRGSYTGYCMAGVTRAAISVTVGRW